ncbi:caspase family protein [Roseofilum sp. Guam]|uniref:caspase family protein n=1 Tax=Roseofilum sp. Guam TaxID=2821502 RepID=UPI001AFEF888|nr:caspase family protein [Roseofilum sp. Guam]MBP0030859.1 caspase family protein [Roseofilum sp. Guam]
MAHPNRRQFLQFIAASLGTVTLNSLLHQANRSAKILAQTTPRKLALLVGINQYPFQPLAGCLNDLELQRHLLIHRFGFNPKDILVVADSQATRNGILTAFEDHLIKQAKTGDIVVYHYSGHGSRIFDPHPIFRSPDNEELNGTFVPIDGELPPGYPNAGGAVKDIMGHTLFLLMSALKTENVTVILDSCFAGGATRDVQVRSRDGGQKVLVSNLEKAYQERFLFQLNLTPEAFISAYRTGVAKGVVLAASAHNQLAREMNINGASCGLFSYLLTHYLWQENSNIEQIFPKIYAEIPLIFKQIPRYEVKVGSNYHLQSPYFIATASSPAQAVVTEVRGNMAKVWLGGVDLRQVNPSMVLTGIDGKGKVRVRSRNGLVAQTNIEEEVQEGALLEVR